MHAGDGKHALACPSLLLLAAPDAVRKDMEDYRKIMARVGWMLVAIGLIDIGVMVYCIMNRIGYSSSFNIFAVIAGIFLIRGNLASARVVAWFLAFSVVGIGLMLLIMSLIEPFSLRATQIKLAPLSFIATVLFSIIFRGRPLSLKHEKRQDLLQHVHYLPLPSVGSWLQVWA